MEIEHTAQVMIERGSIVNSQSQRSSATTGYLFVAGAAMMWGSLGIFFTVLHNQFHLSALSISFVRTAVSAVLLILVLLTFERSLLRISRRLVLFYACFGLIGIALFYLCYIQGVLLTNVATASVLLYTAPVLVTLLAFGLWREPLTARKLCALGLAIGGVLLVAKAYDPGQLQLNLVGVLVGVLAAFVYALYTIFGKSASAQSPYTTTAYSFGFAALFLLPLQFLAVPGMSGDSLATVLRDPVVWPWILALGFGPTLGSYALYNAALQRIPASNASVVATIEPVVASLLGFMVFGQLLAPPQILGELLIMCAALMLAVHSGQEARRMNSILIL